MPALSALFALRPFALRSFLALVVVASTACSEAPERTSASSPVSRRAGDDDRPAAPQPTAAPSGLDAAHAAYLNSDWLGLGDRLHDVLLDPTTGSLARENAFELLDKAYEAQNGVLPSRFVLPPGVSGMKLGVMHGRHAHGTYGTIFLYLRAPDGTAARLTDLSVRRLPNDVLLDKRSGRGTVKIRHDVPGYEDIVLELVGVETPPADGVYGIGLALDDGSAAEGWVLARGLASTAVPEVLSPLPATSTTDENPTVRWVPFRSPQYAPYETRNLSVYVHDEGRKTAAWDYWMASPGETASVRVGAQPGPPPTKLARGSYWLTLTASESRSFGPVRLARTSQAGVPFTVVE